MLRQAVVSVNRGWPCFVYQVNKYFSIRGKPYARWAANRLSRLTAGGYCLRLKRGFGLAANDVVCVFELIID